ncbi:serine/threonine-protein kinase [Aquisphaera insulae]|uniref:serine/threonine-protein kinase n=1 Tax=Aquisphaera insulae TaxID=2712864 RepID=UPI0013ECC511|nr:serine/threonine-protein kinase [Aquisphaera insulae]
MELDAMEVADDRDRRLYEVIGAYYSVVADGGEADIESLIRDHPDLADSLRAFFDQQDRLHRETTTLRPAPTSLGESSAPVARDESLRGSTLGDFVMLAEVGRGGMGIVYEAIQKSLGRRVAVKVLPHVAAMDPAVQRRFQSEAQMAAHMGHPNIVPVYSVGCEGDRHYYAMRLIEGRTVAGWIAEQRRRDAEGGAGRPLDRESCRYAATLCIQAAEALDHAHGLGIIHRDVKPANLIIDRDDKLWVTDFGLALFHGAGELTLTGHALGTLRYMSPEQAQAKRGCLDHRTDVYSLGVTLYEMLTRRPAIDGTDRLEVLRRVTEGSITPPRRLDPAIPRDIETIVLKATAVDPHARYGTASEVAEDLKRFLANRPIRARRPTVRECIVAWGRRRPELVAGSLLTLLLGVIVLAVSAGMIRRERDLTAVALERMTAKEREAALQASRARENADFVLQGVTEPLKKLANPDLEVGPGFVEARRDVVNEAVFVYEEFLRTSAERFPDMPADIGVMIHIGLLKTVAGDHAGALVAYERAVTVAEGQAASYVSKGQYHLDVMGAHAHLGMELWDVGRREEAGPHFRTARSAMDRILVLLKDEPIRWSYAPWFLSLVPDPEFRDPQLALELARRLVAATSEARDNRAHLSRGRRPVFTLGLAEYRAGDLTAARRDLERSMQLRDGGDAHEWFVMAMVLAKQGRREDALTYRDRAVRWMRRYRNGDFELHFLDRELAQILAAAPAVPSTRP